MTKNLYLLLGLPDGASFTTVKKRYQRLTAFFAMQENFCDSSLQRRLRTARESLSETYEEFKRSDIRQAYTGDFECLQTLGHKSILPSSRPRIGQILVAAGVLSIEELDEALAVQLTSAVSMPLGRLLVSWRYLTWEELAYYLCLQDLIKLPPDNPNRLSKQLLELGLISEDQLAIARLDQRTTSLSLTQILVRRKWIQSEVIEQLPAKTKLPTLRTSA